MGTERLNKRSEPLTTGEIPQLLLSQLAHFTLENLHARKGNPFFSHPLALSPTAIAIDIGGSHIDTRVVSSIGGKLEGEAPTVVKGSNGRGFLQHLEKVKEYALAHKFPVAISYPGGRDGTVILDGPNVSELVKEMQEKYRGDFAKLFSGVPFVVVMQDTIAGLQAGRLEVKRLYSHTEKIFIVVNGSGLGAAFLDESGRFWTIEPGHLPVEKALNPYQDRACGLFGQEFTCIEKVAASKVGIEDIWHKRTGHEISGEKISKGFLQKGDSLALELYGMSALLTAHVVQGIANAFASAIDAKTTIVFHGGTFKVPGYGERVEQILEKDLDYTPQVIYTKDFSQNSCLDGAAITALGIL
jgi:hypothetical protein